MAEAKSYGFVPCVKVDGVWHGLFQVSCSVQTGDFKIDPFRGKLRPAETPLEAALRKVSEESVDVLKVHVDDADVGKFRLSPSGVFFGGLSLSQQELFELVQAFDHNAKMADAEKICIDGLAFARWSSAGELTHCKVRVSSQCRSILAESTASFSNMPTFSVRREEDDSGRITYHLLLDDTLAVPNIRSGGQTSWLTNAGFLRADRESLLIRRRKQLEAKYAGAPAPSFGPALPDRPPFVAYVKNLPAGVTRCSRD